MCVLSYGLLAQLPPNPWQMLRDSQRKTLLCFCARSGPTWLLPSWLFGSTAPIELHYLGVSMALASQTTPTSHCKNKTKPIRTPSLLTYPWSGLLGVYMGRGGGQCPGGSCHPSHFSMGLGDQCAECLFHM